VIWPVLLEHDPSWNSPCGYDVKTMPFNDEMRVLRRMTVDRAHPAGDAPARQNAPTSCSLGGPHALSHRFPEISCINALEAMARARSS
jgi:hypothetical protein